MAISAARIHQLVLTKALITPLLDPAQIGPGKVDVRLGHQFLVFNKATGFRAIEPSQRDHLDAQLRQHHQKMTRIAYGREYFLHPGDFVIARTFEYVSLPKDWMAYVVGRSSWGRLGIVIATATFVNPGFQGTITLEITNLGEVPVSLLPLARIAQLVFHPIKHGDAA